MVNSPVSVCFRIGIKANLYPEWIAGDIILTLERLLAHGFDQFTKCIVRIRRSAAAG